MLPVPQFARITGMDVSPRELARARRKLRLEEIPRRAERVTLLQGSLAYRDARLEGFDAAALIEVIEHLEPFRLEAFARILFGALRPRIIVLTTPNRDYNAVFETLPAGKMRHSDHRFEWSQAELTEWASGAAARNGYTVAVSGVGPVANDHGAPSQMAVFLRSEGKQTT